MRSVHFTRSNALDAQVSPTIRSSRIKRWKKEGGVFLLGYEMMRTLFKQKGDMQIGEDLCQGADLVICDEAHRLKNADSQTSKVANSFHTPSRICLTGTPLQNNLLEYYAMVDFVCRSYFGKLEEFRRKYEMPINEGMFADSTETERSLSKQKLYILQRRIQHFVQRYVSCLSKVSVYCLRKDADVLSKDLPDKVEFALSLSLSKIQVEIARRVHEIEITGRRSLWSYVQNMSLIFAHPFIWKKATEERLERLAQKEKEGKTQAQQIAGKELPWEDIDERYILLLSCSSSSGREIVPSAYAEVLKLIDDLPGTIPGRFPLRSNSIDPKDPKHSTKTQALLQIIEATIKAKEKILVFVSRIPTLGKFL